MVCCHLKATAKKSRIRIRNPVYGYKNPDPNQKCHGSRTLGKTNMKQKAKDKIKIYSILILFLAGEELHGDAAEGRGLSPRQEHHAQGPEAGQPAHQPRGPSPDCGLWAQQGSQPAG